MKVKCSLCGLEFEPEKRSCSACPMSRYCNVICCPNCGSQIIVESSLVNLWRRLRKGVKGYAGAANRRGS